MHLGATRLYALLLFAVIAATTSVYASLKDHPSPYLRLHAADPVRWQSWRGEILQQAQAQNKLIYLSIGYFSCHWCHVMQKESYRDPKVAETLNRDYISVKVDRELRPDLDRRMIRFVEEVRGVAGWPLNVFLTPEGYPVTGFTYLPRDDFLLALSNLQQQWRQRHASIKPAAKAYFHQTELDERRSARVSLPDEHFAKVVDAFVAQAMTLADELQGGFGDSSKFPSYPQLNALLQIVQDNPDTDADVAKFLQLTLDNMARLNLRDKVNHGFFRYTTDPDWGTPHYEKMLYDNAQMALLYVDAAKLWPRRGYTKIALQTLQFMNEALWDGEGYAASLSAVDSENIEGAAYLWSAAELQAVLKPDEIDALKKADLWQGFVQEARQIPDLNGLDLDPPARAAMRERLRAASRPLMPRDDKKIASWNALALRALLKAEQLPAGAELKSYSDALYGLIGDKFIQAAGVQRFAGQPGAAESTLEDYATLALALAEYAQSRGSKKAAELSRRLIDAAFDRFLRDDRWIQNANSVIPGEKGEFLVQDAVLESPVTQLLRAVLILPQASPQLQQQARQLIKRMTRDMLDVPYHYASAIVLRQRYQQARHAEAVQDKR